MTRVCAEAARLLNSLLKTPEPGENMEMQTSPPLRRSRLQLIWAKCRKASALFLDLPTFVKVLRLSTSRATRPLIKRGPKFLYRYLGGYLARSLSRDDRGKILVHHYEYLEERLNEGFLGRLIDRPLVLWQEILRGSSCRIHLTLPQSSDMEGDLSLVFQADDVNLYFMSFTIAPGTIANLSAEHILYIVRVQGKGGGLDLIRKATKNCHEVSPPALLLAAAQSIAICLNIKDLIGVRAADQISVGGTSASMQCGTAYDEFWKTMGGEPMNSHMFHLPVPLPVKPLSAIKSKYRSRVIRKRQFKKEVAEQVRRVFQQGAVRAAKGVELCYLATVFTMSVLGAD